MTAIKRPDKGRNPAGRTRHWSLQDAKARVSEVVTGAALVRAMRASPSRELEIEPIRSRMPVRSAGLL